MDKMLVCTWQNMISSRVFRYGKMLEIDTDTTLVLYSEQDQSIFFQVKILEMDEY
jgi:hypothetical protein